MMNLTVNGKSLPVTSPQDTPLLYVLRDELGIDSPQFGCGLGFFGSMRLRFGILVRHGVTGARAGQQEDSRIVLGFWRITREIWKKLEKAIIVCD